jgi:hypothetical protein
MKSDSKKAMAAAGFVLMSGGWCILLGAVSRLSWWYFAELVAGSIMVVGIGLVYVALCDEEGSK